MIAFSASQTSNNCSWISAPGVKTSAGAISLSACKNASQHHSPLGPGCKVERGEEGASLPESQ